ncbi:hypothetical protein BJ138DRAFT_1196291 [Hygrophoropsis aurantiaca]|uniref:Uncharacterized protein n=1 Tax=Hygrophoropsis aurantiaca TaxID=72124 RepID=A0ACB8A870_9AGAM|nr:hypothetical protein BJ138DRAFT_1196291 [Hygrophoropsis aurantiaca]
MTGNKRSKKKESVLSKLRKRKAEVARRPSALLDRKTKRKESGASCSIPALSADSGSNGAPFADKITYPSELGDTELQSEPFAIVEQDSDDNAETKQDSASDDDVPLALTIKNQPKAKAVDSSGRRSLRSALSPSYESDDALSDRSGSEVADCNFEGESGSRDSMGSIARDDTASDTMEANPATEAVDTSTEPRTPSVYFFFCMGGLRTKLLTSVRKSTRTQKVTEKVAALAKDKIVPLRPIATGQREFEAEPDVQPGTAFLQDVAVTSLPAPDSDMSKIERDVMLESTYRDLVPLRRVSLTGTGQGRSTVSLTKWVNTVGGTINKQFVLALVSFKTYSGYINMSRIDPALLTSKAVGKGTSTYVSFLLGQGAQLATCVSVIVVEDCFIGQPGSTAFGAPRKEITGYFLEQEFERFAGAAGAVFARDNFWTYTFNGAFKFGTFVDTNKTQGTSRNLGMFSATPSPSSASAPATRAVLSHDSVGMYQETSLIRIV